MNTCGSCRFRDEHGQCNNEHLMESGPHVKKDLDRSVCLMYSYNEDGGFWVGENFGCVHWAKKENVEGTLTRSPVSDHPSPYTDTFTSKSYYQNLDVQYYLDYHKAQDHEIRFLSGWFLIYDRAQHVGICFDDKETRIFVNAELISSEASDGIVSVSIPEHYTKYCLSLLASEVVPTEEQMMKIYEQDRSYYETLYQPNIGESS